MTNKKDDFLTEFERSKYKRSPSYVSTVDYFEKIANASNFARIITFGESAEGRELKCLIVSKGKDRFPKRAKRSGKAVVLIQNGIHSGEIEGKDACMLLLREMLITREKLDLLNNLILLIIPVLNPDGHERSSPFNRPNQSGPATMGWRTTSLNLNLNRDFTKADSPEMKALIRLMTEWQPDLIIDSHTTNGADYQYHVTYKIEHGPNLYHKLADIGINEFLPYIINRVENDGFLTAPYIEYKHHSLEEGIIDLPSTPRYSTGYAAVRNRLALLIETHSLKDFKTRVFATKSMIDSALCFVNNNHKLLLKLNKEADSRSLEDYFVRKKKLPLDFAGTEHFRILKFKGFASYQYESGITGGSVKKYSSEKREFEIRLFDKAEIKKSVKLPEAYLIPGEFRGIVKILKLHGIRIKQLKNEEKLKVEVYKLAEYAFAPHPYEGRQMVNCKVKKLIKSIIFNRGTHVVPTNQYSIRIIANLLEPEAPDSFFSWGFFNIFMERKEYVEDFVMEPLAVKMLQQGGKLAREFNLRLEDREFRDDPAKRLDFFYRRSKFFDKRENIYPVYRLSGKIDNLNLSG